MLVFGVPTLNRYDLLLNLLKTAKSGSIVPDKFIIVDNGNEFNLNYSEADTIVIRPGMNIGVAAGWNRIVSTALSLDEKADIIISNDDLELATDTLEVMQSKIGDFVSCTELSGLNMFSLFLIRKNCIDRVGCFDENFSPAYFEDNDYYYRMCLKGVLISNASSPVKHVSGGSQTLKKLKGIQMENHHKNFRKNQMYYVHKWGGMPTKETFIVPFNAIGEK